MLLKIGSTGDSVKQVQQKLGLTSDGSFGPKTEAMVKDFQTKNGITPNGIVDVVTWNKMFPNVITEVVKTTNFKLDKLKGHVPDSVITQIPDTAKKFNITSVLRLAHFLSQCGHESGNFKTVNENLNYSKDGLLRVFPKYFPGNLAESYAKQPEKIASRVYGSRMGNGDESTKEGFKFRGRGYIQLTGKANYEKFTKFIGEDCVSNPDLVSTKYPLASAAFFFDSNNLWSICDKGATDDVVTQVTKRVNGGNLGLADRIKHFKEFYSLLS